MKRRIKPEIKMSISTGIEFIYHLLFNAMMTMTTTTTAITTTTTISTAMKVICSTNYLFIFIVSELIDQISFKSLIRAHGDIENEGER